MYDSKHDRQIVRDIEIWATTERESATIKCEDMRREIQKK